ncbi:hypothetical protein BT69DRAFT_1295294 [Atractiella rhizophila]|nr:hypothetical protein BT69DRAFT_1295294 [Atractiella rhizophila]
MRHLPETSDGSTDEHSLRTFVDLLVEGGSGTHRMFQSIQSIREKDSKVDGSDCLDWQRDRGTAEQSNPSKFTYESIFHKPLWVTNVAKVLDGIFGSWVQDVQHQNVNVPFQAFEPETDSLEQEYGQAGRVSSTVSSPPTYNSSPPPTLQMPSPSIVHTPPAPPLRSLPLSTAQKRYTLRTYERERGFVEVRKAVWDFFVRVERSGFFIIREEEYVESLHTSEGWKNVKLSREDFPQVLMWSGKRGTDDMTIVYPNMYGRDPWLMGVLAYFGNCRLTSFDPSFIRSGEPDRSDDIGRGGKFNRRAAIREHFLTTCQPNCRRNHKGFETLRQLFEAEVKVQGVTIKRKRTKAHLSRTVKKKAGVKPKHIAGKKKNPSPSNK